MMRDVSAACNNQAPRQVRRRYYWGHDTCQTFFFFFVQIILYSLRARQQKRMEGSGTYLKRKHYCSVVQQGSMLIVPHGRMIKSEINYHRVCALIRP
jgi:hypothetical protein